MENRNPSLVYRFIHYSFIGVLDTFKITVIAPISYLCFVINIVVVYYSKTWVDKFKTNLFFSDKIVIPYNNGSSELKFHREAKEVARENAKWEKATWDSESESKVNGCWRVQLLVACGWHSAQPITCLSISVNSRAHCPLHFMFVVQSSKTSNYATTILALVYCFQHNEF